MNLEQVDTYRPLTSGFALLFVAMLSACTAFAPVRTAQVDPGPRLTVQASTTTPPGDDAAWLWGWDCVRECDRFIPSAEALVTYGLRSDSGRGYELAIGGNAGGFNLDGYVQLSGGGHPFGLGARTGVSGIARREHQVYARYDVELLDGNRILFNPAFFWRRERSAARGSPLFATGRLHAFMQGIGLHVPGERVSYTPALSVAYGQGRIWDFGDARDFSTFFGMVSLSVTFQQPQ